MEDGKINLGAFQFNVDEVIQGMQELQTQILELSESQKILKDDNETTSATYIEQEIKIKALFNLSTSFMPSAVERFVVLRNLFNSLFCALAC